MIKGMWKYKDKILLMFLIGQVSCSFSFSKSLFAQNWFYSHFQQITEWRNMATFFVTLCFLLVLPVNCNFFAKFFDIMTKIIWSWNLESSDQKPKVNMLLTELAKPWARWWRPGRVETSRRSGGFERAWTRSPRALSVVRASQTHPFPDPSLSAFPVASLCSGRCSVCASSWSLKLRFILFYFISFYIRL